jgi:Domain of unknown function (DUF6438)
VIHRLLTAVLFGISACAPRTAGVRPDEQADTNTNVPAVVLERSPCFGSCPVYTLSVSPDGEVSYEGRAHVKQLGAATARIPKQQVDSLLHELDRAGYFGFADRYVPSEPACGRYATDSPSAKTSVTYRGRTKTIMHDYGCGSVPGALTVLERRIDEMLGSGRWTGREAGK